MVTQITSPSEGFTGTGATGLEFTDGNAYTSSPWEIAFYRDAGYGIGGNPPTAVDSRTVEDRQIGGHHAWGTFKMIDGVLHCYDVTGTHPQGWNHYGWIPAAPEVIGTPLRDAAVEPEESDYHAPVNAGLADPHGPDVQAVPIDGRAL